jgi:hypothetical protein
MTMVRHFVSEADTFQKVLFSFFLIWNVLLETQGKLKMFGLIS